MSKALATDRTVAVIGAGTMGAGIAQVAAQAGHPVRLFDAVDGAVARGIDGVAAQLDGRVAKGKLDAAARDAILNRLQPAASLADLGDASLVIEAIVEDVSVKQQVFGELEGLCGADTILATNTSSLSVTAIAAGLARPQNLVGMHFFNPAPVLRLVEVVRGLATDPAVADTVLATAEAWGKVPVHVRNTPGFIVNRVARPFYAETLNLLEQQAADVPTLDALMRECGGFRMGPCQLMDLIGQDVNARVTATVFHAFHGDARYRPSLVQRELVDAGRLGRKSGLGFYDYGENAGTPAPQSADPRPAPESVTITTGGGEQGLLAPLAERLRTAGVTITLIDGDGDAIEVAGATLLLSDGRLATERAVTEGLDNLVVFDLALDYGSASRIALAAADTTADISRAAAAAVFQAAGLAVSWLDDAPGLVVLRTAAMLANEGANAVHEGIADARGVDNAMQFGVNYPMGPLAWADRLGPAFVLRVLHHLQAAHGDDRYRPSLRLRRLAARDGHFHEGAERH